jgi:hypothetical protein
VRLALLLLLATLAHAQAPATVAALMDAPQPHRLDREERAILLSDAAARVNDWASTQYALRHGARELILPDAVARNPWALAAVEGGAVVGEWVLLRTVGRRHPRLTRNILWGGVALTGAIGGRNWTLAVHRRGEVFEINSK